MKEAGAYIPLGIPVKAIQVTAESASEARQFGASEGDWLLMDENKVYALDDAFFKKRFMPVRSLRLLVTVAEHDQSILSVMVSVLSEHVDQTAYVEAAHEALSKMLEKDGVDTSDSPSKYEN